MTWLYRVTINHCLNLMRDQGRRRDLLRAQPPPAESADATRHNGHAAPAGVRPGQPGGPPVGGLLRQPPALLFNLDTGAVPQPVGAVARGEGYRSTSHRPCLCRRPC
jgi:hypothetical protein